jgi:hypothetical protein
MRQMRRGGCWGVWVLRTSWLVEGKVIEENECGRSGGQAEIWKLHMPHCSTLRDFPIALE